MPDQVTQGEHDDYVLISALNQYNYCPLRCYWMFVEHEYADNDHTIEGTLGHARVHTGVLNASRPSCAVPTSSSRPRVAASAASASAGIRGGRSAVTTSPSGVTMRPPCTPPSLLSS